MIETYPAMRLIFLVTCAALACASASPLAKAETFVPPCEDPAQNEHLRVLENRERVLRARENFQLRVVTNIPKIRQGQFASDIERLQEEPVSASETIDAPPALPDLPWKTILSRLRNFEIYGRRPPAREFRDPRIELGYLQAYRDQRSEVRGWIGALRESCEEIG